MTLTYTVAYFLVALLSAAVNLIIVTHLNVDMGSERERKAFRMFAFCFTVFCGTNAVWIWINNGYLHWDGTANSMLNLISVCTSAYYWFRYISLRIDPRGTERLRFRLASLIPLAIVAALVLSTPFTHLVFYYNENNKYTHGPLYVAMAALALFYLLIASLRILRNLSQTKSPVLRREYQVLMEFLLYPLIGGIVDVFIPNLPVMELSVMAGAISVFTNMQTARIYHDSLTGLYNRRRADEYLTEQIMFVTEEEPLYFFIADADRFKEINDRYGHLEGDRALRIIGQALREATGTLDCCVARWGGDEFAIIAEHHVVPDPDALIVSINLALAKRATEEKLPYVLRLSIGYTTCNSGSILGRELFRRADQMMYQEKAQRHAGDGGMRR